MATNEQRTKRDAEAERREAGRRDTGTGNAGPGAVDGLGGAGGASGTGGVREQAGALGDPANLDQGERRPAPGSAGKGISQRGQANDGGLSGRTRGPDGETVPNQEDNS